MSDRAPITTHILDLATGRPAANVALRLFGPDGQISTGTTNEDGRVNQWDDSFEISPGKYRIEFDVEPYFEAQGAASFYEDVHIAFRIRAADEHYHVPLLLSAFGYSTYRGS